MPKRSAKRWDDHRIRFVAIKTQTQQEVLALHRVRALLIRERTALTNQMCGLLAEILGDGDSAVGDILRKALLEISECLRSFEQRLERHGQQIEELARGDNRASRLMKVPGVRLPDRDCADSRGR